MANNIVINVLIPSSPLITPSVRLCSSLDISCNALLVASRKGRAKRGLQIRSRRNMRIRKVGREVVWFKDSESINGVIGVEINQVTKGKRHIIELSSVDGGRGRPVFKETKI